MKSLLLFVLLLAHISSQADQDQVLTFSSSSNTEISAPVQDKSFVQRLGDKSNKRIDMSKQSADLGHLEISLNKDESKWLYPVDAVSKKAKLWGIGWYSKYTFCICTDCPKNPATIYVGASNYFVLTYANGTVVGSGYGWSPLRQFTVNLKCGCKNNFILYVYNYASSPLGGYYRVVQSTRNCYTCQNLGVTHYNRDTCTCECVHRPSITCPCKKPQTWQGYPSCGCTCPKSLLCASNRYFSLKTCGCECKQICCPAGFIQNFSTCSCMRIIKLPPTAALAANEKVCGEEKCDLPQVWNPKDCKCI